MHPNYVRQAKALVWYWLNRHPAEVYHSPTEGQEQGFVEDNQPYDMLVVNARTGWKVGGGVSDRLYTDRDPDRWHDINRVITEWFDGGSRMDRLQMYEYLRMIKGEPINRWKMKYTGLPAPYWKELVERFWRKGYIKIDLTIQGSE